jgi:hypothetical protein
MDWQSLQWPEFQVVRVTAVALNDLRKACPWNEFHDLCKQGLADIHGKSPSSLSLGK